MHMTLLGAVARGAFIGGVMGLGVSSVSGSDLILAGIVAGVALAVLGYYAGAAAVVGAVIGAAVSRRSDDFLPMGIFGAVIGYAIGLAG